MRLTIGQKVVYPGQGACIVVARRVRDCGTHELAGFELQVIDDTSIIFVPESNADSVGIRPLLTPSQCKRLVSRLGEDFDEANSDWKSRSREFMQKIQSADIFAVADVFKKLTYLSREKRLSFREQTLLDKARSLIVSELANGSPRNAAAAEHEVIRRVDRACEKHIAANGNKTSTAH
ncbi:MAG: hypothetical protein KF736_01150 [Acidobacteria bacterium]|nr:hypothetical protein [Acidobacteriota bacterium]MCW5948083.1 hypothetical protein [Pyrinomonadaceae bacterium]